MKRRGIALFALLGLIAAAGLILWLGPARPGDVRSDAAAVKAPTAQKPGQAAEGAEDAAATRKRAPDFERVSMEGRPFRLSEHRGEVVVLNFWATWCAPCRIEIPGFIALQRQLGEQGVRFVGVSLDEEGFEVVRPYADEMGINYPLVLDDGTLAERYGGQYALPTTVLIDRQGFIRQRMIGQVDEETLRPLLNALLKEKA